MTACSQERVYQPCEHAYSTRTKPEELCRHEHFAPPVEWRALVQRLDARYGVRVAEFGLFHIASHYWTTGELDEAARLLDAILTMAEHAPGGLDVPVHMWASSKRQDLREAAWLHARLNGQTAAFRRRRDAERRADRLARAMREEVAA